MSGFSDFKDALNMFSEGVQSLGQSRSLMAANEEVQNIKNTEASEYEKRQAYQDLARKLTLNLSRQGANAAQIEAVTGGLVPKAPTIQTYDQGLAQASAMGDTKGQETFQGLVDEEQKRKLQQIDAAGKFKIISSQNGQDDKNIKNILAVKNKFAELAKKDRDSITSLDSNLSLLQQGDHLGYVTALKGVIRSTDERISDADFKLASPNPDLADRAARIFSLAKDGKDIPVDVEAVNVVSKILRNKAEGRIKSRASGYAKSRSGLLKGIDHEALANDLVLENIPGADGQGGGAGGGGGTQAGQMPPDAVQKTTKDGRKVWVRPAGIDPKTGKTQWAPVQ